MAGGAHEPRAPCCTPRVARRRAAVRLVRGAALRRLSRHADARLRADRLGDRVPVGGTDWRLERRHRRLAEAALQQDRRLFPPDPGSCRYYRACPAPHPVRAVRLRHARRPRQPLAGRSDRHRRQACALAGLRACRRGVRRRRRPVRLRQGLDLAGNDQRRPLDRRPRHGAARRHPDADRTDRRRIVLRDIAGHGDAPDRILARAARRHQPRAGVGLPAGHCRRCVILVQAKARAMTVLAVRSLSKSFGGVHAVNVASFEIGAGEFLAMIGPNGAGKSTCFNMINGQLTPDAGEILLNGENIAGLAPREVWRRRVGRTFQLAATFASMAVAVNVQMALISPAGDSLALWRPAAPRHRERAPDLPAHVATQVAAYRPSRAPAYGDIKRIELAIALADEPKLLLMDEPTAGKAPRERNALLALVKRLVVGRGIADGNAASIRDNAQVREVYFGTGKTFARGQA